jgi:hypothetical protein
MIEGLTEGRTDGLLVGGLTRLSPELYVTESC